MHITEIRIAGFKSFVDPTEFHVEPGLTGIVGPNGCGKSNLLEALRWAMGANSARAMRGGEMDDLIFSGSEHRPPRELAEVTLVLDNQSRTAPPAFNDTDVLEVTRRLKRQAGSTYKINGRTVRGKDIQLIFADASTGANSPALVRQGQISELIASKPQNRRRILEEAAGIAGLNTRRHEAELKLRAAETNLERLSEVSAEVERQLESLKRQARKARKYKELSSQIEALDALSAHLRWQSAQASEAAAREALETAKTDVERLTREAALAENAALKAREEIPPLREKEAEAAAKVGQVRVQLARVETERKSAEDNLNRLKTELERLGTDIASEEESLTDAKNTVEQLTERLERLEKPDPEREAREEAEAKARVEMASNAVKDAEAALDTANASLATKRAEAEAARSRVEAETRRKTSIDAEVERLRAQLLALPELAGLEFDLTKLVEERFRKSEARDSAEAAQEKAETRLSEAQAALEAARAGLADADRQVRELEAEAKGLERLLRRADGPAATPVIDEMRITAGFEKAVAAALGDDLNAPRDRSAPAFWSGDATADRPALPAGVRPLSELAEAPDALSARLSQCGLVDEDQGPALAHELRVGQRLVSREGHLWRWDGYTRTPDAPLSEAERLAQKARLEAIGVEIEGLKEARETAAARLETAKTEQGDARDGVSDARARLQTLERETSALRESVLRAEQAVETAKMKRAALQENLDRALASQTEIVAALADLPQPGEGPGQDLVDAVEAARSALGEARQGENAARAALNELIQSRQQAEGRRRGISRDLEDWKTRAARHEKRLNELKSRQTETSDALERAGTPDKLIEDVERLSDQLTTLDAARQSAADAYAEAETALREAESASRTTGADASRARESLAGAKVALDGASARIAELDETIRAQFSRAPDGLMTLARAGLEEEDIAALDLRETERQSDLLKHDRASLGGVNLEAEAEVAEMEERLGGQQSEREDLEQAIGKLREGVAELNEEGRERLLAAFETVNAHFQTLFTTLFRGGQAELRLIDADDPLAAGLEIMAQPPGKRLGNLALMSGGEQALTATALIFAVFLSNPAPICVLDEVDAPLDDANVDRYCRLLEEMCQRTETRFVVITHNAVTMSRMDRLFGVTMREKGVSKLVSVDLRAAEDLVAAE